MSRKSLRQPFNPLMMAATPTTTCLGLLTLKGGVRVVGMVSIVTGVLQVGWWLPDFSWGPPSYDLALKRVDFMLGLASIGFGVLCFSSAVSLNLRDISRVKNFRRLMVLWTCVWFCAVGLPTEIVYKSVPVFGAWPLFSSPFIPKKVVVDPEWPNGRPQVCGDVSAFQERLVQSWTPYSRRKFVRGVAGKLGDTIFNYMLPCDYVLQIFGVWMVIEMVLVLFCAIVMAQFELVVLNGGDGVMMIGDPTDLSKPVNQRAIVKHQVQFWFEQIDADKDGKVTLEEMIDYMEGREAFSYSV